MFKCTGHVFSVVFGIDDGGMMCSTELIQTFARRSLCHVLCCCNPGYSNVEHGKDFS